MKSQAASTAELFNEMAHRYDSAVKELRYFAVDYLEREVTQNADQIARVLDIGCATGLLGNVINRHRPSAELIGLDISPAMIERARATGIYQSLYVHDMNENLTLFQDQSFDFLMALGVLEFISDIGQCLKEIARVLTPGGVAYLSFQEFEDANAQKPRTTRTSESVSLRAYSIDEVRGLARMAGLSVEHLEQITAYQSKSGFRCPFIVVRCKKEH